MNTIDITHNFIKKYCNMADIAVDATMGRGNDTLFLSQIVGGTGSIFAFDIQEEALGSTSELLKKNNCLDNVKLILDSHTNMENYLKEDTIDIIMFNLGYLPKGDHSIGTKAKSTIKAINDALKLIKVNGIISICIYHGGDTGFDEKNEVMEYIKTIDDKKYTVIQIEFSNKPNNPPIFVGIIREK